MPKTSFKLTPELDVADLDCSLAFYVDVIGFQVLFDRTEERFVFLDLDGVHLMLEEAAGPGRSFRTAPLEYPYGRGFSGLVALALPGQMPPDLLPRRPVHPAGDCDPDDPFEAE